MLPTKNDLPADVRVEVVARVNQRAAEAVDLWTQAKQAHWNVRGPNFAGLHKLFDEIADEAAEHADLLAERAVQLGGLAAGTARVVAQKSTLPEYPVKATGWRQHVEAIALALAAFGRAVRADIDWAAEAGDADTADICTDISRAVDKKLWMVEAHGDEERLR